MDDQSVVTFVLYNNIIQNLIWMIFIKLDINIQK
jgi:hypothetical protein